MTKTAMQFELTRQLDEIDIVVKTMVCQDLIWPGYSECRLFTNHDDVYSAVFLNDEKITEFMLCPKGELKQ